MPRLQRNDFIDKHKLRYGLALSFDEYLRAKNAAKGPKLTMRDGKTVPTPNQVIAALLRETMKGDYFLESEMNGSVQIILFSVLEEANAAQKFHGAGAWKKSDGKPATHVCSAFIDMKRHLELAKKLKLL